MKRRSEEEAADPRPEILKLQETAGNRAVSELVGDGLPEHVAGALQSPGQSLDPTVRAQMEARLGRDLRDVRLHTDLPAAESARKLDSRAYTLGQDIVFGPGQYAPQTARGRRLLAHELIHTLQTGQQSGPSRPVQVSRPGDAAEREAAGSAAATMSGQAVQVSQAGGPATIYRSVIAELLDSLDGGLWIDGPYADITVDLLIELTGLDLYRDRDGQVFTNPRQPRKKKGTSATAARLIQEIVANGNIRVVVNAPDLISGGLIGAFDVPSGTGRQQVDIPDIEAAAQSPGIHAGAALFHEISEAYFGRLVAREPALQPPGKSLYEVAHPMALEAENRVRRELGLPAREHDEFPLIQLPPDITGSSIPYAISIEVFETHFQVSLLSQDPASGNIAFEQTFVLERDLPAIDWDRDWQAIVNQVAPRFRFRP